MKNIAGPIIMIAIGLICAVLTILGAVYLSPLNMARHYLYDKDPKIRQEAIWLLHINSDRMYSQKIREFLKDTDPEVRSAAISALGGLQDKEAIPDIIKLLSDSEAKVRRSALWVIGGFQAKEAIPSIKVLLLDTDKGIRYSAELILKQLGVPEEEIQKAKEK